ncbi:MAG: hypothetical protein AB9903_06050 [Vulcanimicrobiota bacterium]
MGTDSFSLKIESTLKKKSQSPGGCDEHWNLLTVCQHHRHIIHDLMALKIEVTAPHNLTFTFEPTSGDSDRPFLTYHKGRKQLGEHS